MRSMRPRWKNELRAYLEANLSEGEKAYVQDTAKTRSYKKEKDDVSGKASQKNLQATERRLMVADTLTMMERAAISTSLDLRLNGNPVDNTRSGVGTSFFSRTIDLELRDEDVQHLKNSRMHGVLYTPGGAYSVLNLGTMRRTIRTLGEMRYQYLVNTTLPKSEPLTRLIMFGRDTYKNATGEHMRLALEYLKPDSNTRAREGQSVVSFNSISGLYREAHYIPETLHGIHQLRLLSQPYFWERLAGMLGLEVSPQSVYDATDPSRNDKTVACCNLLTGNLNSFSRILSAPPSCIKRIYMFPWQEDFYNQAIEEMGIRDKRNPLHINAKSLDPVFLELKEIEAAFGLGPLESYYRARVTKDDGITTSQGGEMNNNE